MQPVLVSLQYSKNNCQMVESLFVCLFLVDRAFNYQQHGDLLLGIPSDTGEETTVWIVQNTAYS